MFRKKNLIEKHIVEANLTIHYHSLIEVYGYMWGGMYEWAKTGKTQGERKRIFIPEDEFLSKIREKGYAYVEYDATCWDSNKNFVKGTGFFRKSEVRNELRKSAIFYPGDLIDEKDVHNKRKLIVRKWLEYEYPFVEYLKALPKKEAGSYIGGDFELKQWIFSSLTDLLVSLRLLNERDAELGLYDLREETRYLKDAGIVKKDFDFGEPDGEKSKKRIERTSVTTKPTSTDTTSQISTTKKSLPNSPKSQQVPKAKQNDKSIKLEVRCSNCREVNALSERQIRQKQIFHPICKICLKELPLDEN